MLSFICFDISFSFGYILDAFDISSWKGINTNIIGLI